MAVALWVGGCAGVQTPPVRGLPAQMPGLVSNRQMELGASIGGWPAPMLVPYAGLQLTDAFGLEAGLNGSATPLWLAWWAGARVTLEKGLGIASKMYTDVEVGGGMSGFYGGLGVGLRLAYFGLYGRARGEWAVSDLVGTLSTSCVLGAEMRVAHHLVVWLAGGYVGRWTAPVLQNGAMYQAGIRYFFDVPI